MGAWPPSHMQSLIFATICLHGALGMWHLNLLTKVMYLTLESLPGLSHAPSRADPTLRLDSDSECSGPVRWLEREWP